MESKSSIKLRKKLIEVAIPLGIINDASAREKSIRFRHPSTIHLWWARKPLASARAVIFCQLVDDPSSVPEEFPTFEEQEIERKRLFSLISELVEWENASNEELLKKANVEIKKSWERCCSDNRNLVGAKTLFNSEVIPSFHDPFAGGGSIPLEAQRLGLKSYASDLNPVSVFINKALIEIPCRFANLNPICKNFSNNTSLIPKKYKGSEGLSEDIKYYGDWLNMRVNEEIGLLYPKVLITSELVDKRPDLKKYLNKELKIITWIWVRTIKSPNPVFANKSVPLASSFLLSSKENKEAYVVPTIKNSEYFFEVQIGKPADISKVKTGTKLSRGANFKCILSDDLITPEYIKAEGKAGKIGNKLMAIVVEGKNQRIYLPPLKEYEPQISDKDITWKPDLKISGSTQYLGIKPYGYDSFDKLFTPRQLFSLNKISDLITEVVEKIKIDFDSTKKLFPNYESLEKDNFIENYSLSIALYLSFAINRLVMSNNNLVRWNPVGQKAQHCFGRQALSMTWNFAEPNLLGSATGSLSAALFYSYDPLINLGNGIKGDVFQEDATTQKLSENKIISTDPPYYDNVPFADLSDFFYVWLRKILKNKYPKYLQTLASPKQDELVAFAHRHNNKEFAESFFLSGMTKAMQRVATQAHLSIPITIYYAFKQSETKRDEGRSSTGWETFLEAVLKSGLIITGTWPLRTELKTRMRSLDSNALASSIVLVCRIKNHSSSKVMSSNEFRRQLNKSLPKAINELKKANIAPVDVEQAAIGPGMSIFSEAKVILKPDDSEMTVREALAEINRTLQEYISENETNLDTDSLFALTFFESFGYTTRPYGDAEGLARARNISVEGVVKSGILKALGGKVNLIKRQDLHDNWDPALDSRLCIWEATQYLIKTLDKKGEIEASILFRKLKNIIKVGDITPECKSLAYRLYDICEKKNLSEEAKSYNSLIISWPEIERLSSDKEIKTTIQTNLI